MVANHLVWAITVTVPVAWVTLTVCNIKVGSILMVFQDEDHQ
jgi:hypothetical protein